MPRGVRGGPRGAPHGSMEGRSGRPLPKAGHGPTPPAAPGHARLFTAGSPSPQGFPTTRGCVAPRRTPASTPAGQSPTTTARATATALTHAHAEASAAGTRRERAAPRALAERRGRASRARSSAPQTTSAQRSSSAVRASHARDDDPPLTAASSPLLDRLSGLDLREPVEQLRRPCSRALRALAPCALKLVRVLEAEVGPGEERLGLRVVGLRRERLLEGGGRLLEAAGLERGPRRGRTTPASPRSPRRR